VFTQSQQKHNTKAPFELVRPSKAVETEEENDSDFTLLNVKNEVEVDKSVINVKSERSKPHANAKVTVNANNSEGSSKLVIATEARSTKTNTNESKVQDCESDSREMDGKVIELAAVRTDLENVVFRLESLLTEETLLRRKEILESLGRMKSLLTMLPEDKQRLGRELLQIESRGTETGAKVTTLAVDVAKYFEE